MNMLSTPFTAQIARQFAMRARRSSLRTALVSLCGAALLAGCSKDLDYDSEPVFPEPPQTEEGRLILSISMAGISSAAPGTYALSPEDEGFVDMKKFNVLLFSNKDKDAADADYKFVQFAPVKERTGGNNNVNTQGHIVRHFSIELPASADYVGHFYKAMVVANYSPVAEGTPDADKPETIAREWQNLFKDRSLEVARTLIRFEQTDGQPWGTDTRDDADADKKFMPLPLWGETASPFNAQMQRVSTIPMLRAVARVDVGVNLGGRVLNDQNVFTGKYDLGSKDYNGQPEDRDGVPFELVSVTLYNSSRTGYLIPRPDYLTHDRRGVTKPTVDQTTDSHSTSVNYAYAGLPNDPNAATNMLRGRIYLPETFNKTDANEAACYIVVGGKWNNSGNVTYYRVDFYDRTKGNGGTEHEGYVKPSSDNRYDILRNYAYVINILRVRGEGYPTAEMAAKSEPINMEVDILTWDTGGDLSNVVTDGQYRLMLSSTRLQYHMDGTAQDLDVFTDFFIAGDDQNSGWKLWMDKNDHEQDVQVWAEAKDGSWASLTKTERDGRWYWTGGPANETGKLRVGLGRFDEHNNTGFMERTVRLTFTAGRMSQVVELVQDVKNTRTLSLLQQKLFFPKYPGKNQSVILKSSPAGATYYAVFQGKDKKTYRLNLSNPDDTESTVQGRDCLGGINSVLTQHPNPENVLPDGFWKHDSDAGVESQSCKNIELFVKVVGGEHMFTMRPSNWDGTHNGGDDPKLPRSWRFEIEAYWDDPDAGAYDANPERTRLDVEQSHYDVSWKVKDAGNNGVLVTDPTHPNYDPNIPDNHVWVPWNIGTATPSITTVPDQMPWYFLSKKDEGNLSGKEWVLSWPDMQYNGAAGNPYPGLAKLNVRLTDNESLYPRSVTFQASSAIDGFDRSTAKLKITQGSGNLKLVLEKGIGVTELPESNKTYTLNYGTLTSRTLRAVNVRANTDWWWEWRKKDDGTEMGDKDIDRNYLESYGKTGIHLHHDHPYWKNLDNSVDNGKYGYIISEWLGHPSVVKNPGKEHATKDNGDEKAYERLWDQAFITRSVQGVFLAPNATNDDAVTSRKIPLAGTYYSEVQFYNEHDIMYDAADPDHTGNMQGDWADKVKAASKILRIQRTVPSFTFLAELPFNKNNNVCLSNFTKEELEKGGTAVPDNDPRLWENQKLIIRSNNKIKITLYNAKGQGDTWGNPFGSYDYVPENGQGYGKAVDITLGELAKKMNNGKLFIDPEDVLYSNDKGFFRYKIEITGWRQSAKDGPDEPFTEVREYYAGYWLVHPETKQISRGGKYSSKGFTLLLDFGKSSYHSDQRIRIGRKMIQIGDFSTGMGDGAQLNYTEGQPEYREYSLDGSKFQRYIEYVVPENDKGNVMWIYWVEFQPYAQGTPFKREWSDGGYASHPEKDRYLFLQDAKSSDRLIFLKDGPVVPEIPDIADWFKRSDIRRWERYDTSASTYRAAGFECVPREGHWISPKTYNKNYYETYSGRDFHVACGGNSMIDSKNEDRYLGNYVSQAYKNVWKVDGHDVYKQLHMHIYGAHWFFGSVTHHRWVVKRTTQILYAENINCPDEHGIGYAEWEFRKIVGLKPYYETSLGNKERKSFKIIVLADAFTATAPLPPIINGDLAGKEVVPQP